MVTPAKIRFEQVYLDSVFAHWTTRVFTSCQPPKTLTYWFRDSRVLELKEVRVTV